MRPLLAVALAVLLGGCTNAANPDAPTPSATAAVRAGCDSPVRTGPLPEWARAGFSGDSSMPHVVGDRGEIVAALFGYPLKVLKTNGPSNKILWVSKVLGPDGDLVIDASLDGSTVTARRSVPGGPGPSIVDLPEPGCWRLSLTWPQHSDTMTLVYQ